MRTDVSSLSKLFGGNEGPRQYFLRMYEQELSENRAIRNARTILQITHCELVS